MIRIEIVLVPGGFWPARRVIAEMAIANVTNLADTSDYRVEIREPANGLTGAPARAIAFELKAHDRRQPIWPLLEKVCRGAMDVNPAETG
jgi:hypothetical protein